jgi:hypothetical protein
MGINNIMNKDSHQIFETYKQKPANLEIISEGMFDTLKARGAQAVGAVKGLGQQAAGAVKGAVAGAKGDVAGVEAAQQQKKLGAVQGDIAKVESYKKTALKKIDNLTKEMFDDMSKLGINVKGVSPNSAKLFSSQMGKAFDALVADIKKAP